MKFTYNFEKLEVWKLSKDFAVSIYRSTESFPAREKYGLISQLTRAAISVSSNIAEGNSRKSNKEKAHFLDIAYGSLMETASTLSISKDLEFISKNQYSEFRTQIEAISNKIIALKNYHLKIVH
ncbi:MAG: four helix bundle protein [Bacteroidales bacterium]|nr:four helix bundle protein [Bacteroidales bacterium]